MRALQWLVRFIAGSIIIAIVSTGIAILSTWIMYHELDWMSIQTIAMFISATLIFLVYIMHPAMSELVMREVHLNWIRRFWQPHLTWLWVLAVLTLLSSGVALAYPLVFSYVIDFTKSSLAQANPEMASTVTWRAVWVIAIIGLARSVTLLYPGFRAMLNAKLGMDVRAHYFAVILTKGHKFFQKFRTGDLVTRLTDDIEGFPKIAWFTCSGIFRALESGSKFVFCMAFMLFMNWKLALLTITPLPIMLTLFYFLRMALTKAALANQQAISETNDYLEAAFSGVRISKAFRAEANQAATFREILNRRITTELRLIKLWMGLMNLYQWVQNIGQVIVMVAGGIMAINGTLTIGELYAFYIYLSLLLAPLMDIPQLFVSSRQAFACIDREIELESSFPEPLIKPDGLMDVRHIDSIVLDNISFRFETELPLSLDHVNISLKQGEKAAIVGSVGSGKSTLIKIVAGLIPPTDGAVKINGSELSKYDISDYRSRVGYIPQESTLFSETVAENVSFGRGIPEPDVRMALDIAQVLEEMDKLPKGINEVLGQKGLTVSGGQKQRLAIARALAGQPDLLLMDDCTSALDAENERRFWEMFAAKFPQTSCLIVTHRLATARKADVIYVLDEGKIVGKGTHEELLRECEEYQNFLTRDELRAALSMA